MHFIALRPVKQEFSGRDKEVISRKRSYLKSTTHIRPEEVFLIEMHKSRSIQRFYSSVCLTVSCVFRIKTQHSPHSALV